MDQLAPPSFRDNFINQEQTYSRNTQFILIPIPKAPQEPLNSPVYAQKLKMFLQDQDIKDTQPITHINDKPLKDTLKLFNLAYLNQLKVKIKPEKVIVKSFETILKLFEGHQPWLIKPKIYEWQFMLKQINPVPRLISFLQNYHYHQIDPEHLSIAKETFHEFNKSNTTKVIPHYAKILYTLAQELIRYYEQINKSHPNENTISLQSEDNLHDLQDTESTHKLQIDQGKLSPICRSQNNSVERIDSCSFFYKELTPSNKQTQPITYQQTKKILQTPQSQVKQNLKYKFSALKVDVEDKNNHVKSPKYSSVSASRKLRSKSIGEYLKIDTNRSEIKQKVNQFLKAHSKSPQNLSSLRKGSLGKNIKTESDQTEQYAIKKSIKQKPINSKQSFHGIQNKQKRESIDVAIVQHKKLIEKLQQQEQQLKAKIQREVLQIQY